MDLGLGVALRAAASGCKRGGWGIDGVWFASFGLWSGGWGAVSLGVWYGDGDGEIGGLLGVFFFFFFFFGFFFVFFFF